MATPSGDSHLSVTGSKSRYHHYDIQFHSKSVVSVPPALLVPVNDNFAPPVFKPIRSNTCCARLVYRIQALWHLIKNIFKFLRTFTPQYAESNAYAHLLLGGTGAQLPNVLNSQICRAFCEFLSKERHIPPSLIPTMRQTAEWMATIEKATIIQLFSSRKHQILSDLAQSMSTRIKSLRDGEFCIIPGGLQGKFALYRVTKVGTRYDWEFLSRDPTLPHGEEIGFLKREKICIGTVFAGLSEAEVSNPRWLQALLDIQIGREDHYALFRLFEGFKGRKIDPVPSKKPQFHKALKDARVGTLWSLIEGIAYKGNKSQGKLRRQVFALYRYSEELSALPKIPASTKEVTLQASKRIRQKMLSMVEKEQLTKEEAERLNVQINRVEEMVQEGRRQEATTSAVTFKPIDLFLLPRLNTVTISPLTRPLVSEPERKEVEEKGKHESERKVAAYRGTGHLFKKITLPDFETLLPADLIGTIETHLKEIEGEKDPLALQYKIIDLCAAIPFNNFTVQQPNQHGIQVTVANPKEVWALCTADDRIRASALFTRLGMLLFEKAKSANTLHPNRHFALTKCFFLVQHLAILNRSITGIQLYREDWMGSHYGDDFFDYRVGSILHDMARINYDYFSTDRSSYRNRWAIDARFFEQFASFRYLRKDVHIASLYRNVTYFDKLASGKVPRCAQSEHLVQLNVCIQQLLENTERLTFVAEKLDQWGRGFQDRRLLSAVHGTEVARNSYSGSSSTQEAMVDDPMSTLKDALSLWMSRCPSEKWREKTEGKKIEELSIKQLTDLLLTLDNGTAIWNILGLIEEQSSILFHPDVCNHLEYFLVNLELLQRALENDGKLHERIQQFFDVNIAKFIVNKDFHKALFLIHLSQSMRASVPELHALKDYSPLIHEWIQEASRTSSHKHPYFHALLTEALLAFQNHEALSEEELLQMTVYGFALDTAEAHPDLWDPVQHDHVKRVVKRWQPQLIDSQRNREFLHYAIDAIFRLHGKRMPEGIWEGGFPEYRLKGHRIDLMNGIYEDPEGEGFSDQYLPITILKDPTFKKAFPNILTTRPKITKYETPSGRAYAFKDEKGQENRIEKSGQRIRCFRKHPQRDEWLLAIMPPAELLEKLPSTIGQLTFYLSCDRPQEWFAFSDSCEAQFFLRLERVERPEDDNESNRNRIHQFRLADVDDLRSAGLRRGYQVAVPSIESHPALINLFSFEHPSHITLWAHNERIEYIELARHGLCFSCVNGQWQCDTPSFAGYALNLHPTSSQLGGLAAGLLLEHPSQVAKVLLPKFSGSFSPYPEFNPNFGMLQGRLAQIKMVGKLLSHFVLNPAPPPGSVWFQGKDSSAGFWTFDSQRASLSSREENGHLWFDLLCHSIMSLYRPTCSSYTAIRKALFELSKLSFKETSDEQFFQWRMQLEKILKAETINNDAIASALQCLLVLHEKAPPRLLNSFKGAIANASLLYFSAGKHTDISVSLNKEQIALTLSCLEMVFPDEAIHVRRIIEGDFKELSVATRKVKFFNITFKRSAPDTSISQVILSEMQERNRSIAELVLNSELFLNRDLKHVLKSFQKLYEAARKRRVGVVNFEKMHLTAKLLPSVGAATNFLELLFELKEEFPDLPLPLFPTLEFATPDWQGKHNDEEKKKAINEKSAKEFLAFMDKVLAVVNTAFGERKVLSALEGEVKEEDPRKATAIVPIRRPAALPPVDKIVSLERIIANALKVTLTASMECQPEDSLFNERELANYFTISEAESKEIALDLTEERAKEEEPATKVFVDELQSEMEGLRTQREQRIEVIPEAEEKIAAELRKKIDHHRVQGEKIAAEIMAQINMHRSHLLVGAGYRHSLTWTEVFDAVRHSNLENILEQVGIVGVDLRLVEKRMGDFLRAESKRKYAEYCLSELQSMVTEDILKVSGEKLHEMLSRPRAYDPLKFPQILILEEILGFYIRKRQMDIACAFVTDPSSIRCALTGDGKTSVILTLAGLLKPSKGNLVTLKFLDPLFAENFAQLNRVLQGGFNRQVMPLLFSMKQPLVLRRKLEPHECVELERKEKEEKAKESVRITEVEESYFKRLYQKSLENMAQQGIHVSNKRSQPLIQAKFISILYKLSILPTEEAIKEQYDIEWEHVKWNAKNLLLYKNSQEQALDEHDKFCNPRDELHLRIGGTDPIPPFFARTILEILEELRQHKELGLATNTHAELSSKQRDEIRYSAAGRMAKIWSERNPKLDPKALTAYFQGTSEDILKGLEEVASLEECDAITLTKDMLTVFLKLTLSKKGNAKYILSSDGVSVIPASYVDKPREGSEFEDIRERMPYLIQYIYFHGIPVVYFTRWVNDLVRSAEEERQKHSLTTIDDTSFNKLFRTYFPDQQLSRMSNPERIEKVHADYRKDPVTVRKFIELLLSDLRVSKRKVTIDAQNLVSLSRCSAGTSATKGCVEGLHRQFRFEDDSRDFLRAKMIRRFQRRLGGQPLLTFDPAKPDQVVPALMDQDRRIGVVIDGAGATWGVPSETCAQTILTRTGLSAVGFFDSADRLRSLGDPKATLRERGQFYSQAQSRGADVKLSPTVLAALMAHWRNSLSESLQNEGRLRHILQPMRLVVPLPSGISRAPQLLYQNCVVESLEGSDDLYRNKMQEQRDIVREAMLMELMTSAAALTPDRKKKLALLERFKALKVGNYLVTENGAEWSKPGSYFKANKHIERRDGDPVAILNERMLGHRKVAEDLRLSTAVTALGGLNYEPLRPKLPRHVDSLKLLGKEAEVETEMEVQAETEVAVQVETETTVVARDERTTYLPWMSSYDNNYRIHAYTLLHPAFDTRLRFTENFLPLNRPAYAHPVHWRKPHDHRQNRLHYIKFSEDGGNLIATACDLMEFNGIVVEDRLYGRGPFQEDARFVYDIKLRHIIFIKHAADRYSPTPAPPLWTAVPSHLAPQVGPLVAQMRFEDGQYDTYSPEELRDLEAWIRKQKDPAALERYFVTEVLKNRPQDQERYRLGSPLFQLFRTIC